MNMFPTNTVEEIVDDLMFKVDDSDKKRILNPPKTTKGKNDFSGLEQIWFETSLMRWIRNHYGLWHTHPLTKRWREDGPNDLRDNTDYSTDHPDNISGVIYERFKERLAKAGSR
jgi:hypothetical protein